MQELLPVMVGRMRELRYDGATPLYAASGLLSYNDTSSEHMLLSAATQSGDGVECVGLRMRCCGRFHGGACQKLGQRQHAWPAGQPAHSPTVIAN